MQDLIAKAANLLEAVSYVKRLRSQRFVARCGGRFLAAPDPAARNVFNYDLTPS